MSGTNSIRLAANFDASISRHSEKLYPQTGRNDAFLKIPLPPDGSRHTRQPNDTAEPQSCFLDLVERFERNREAYKSGNYNETQVRREFLDPFLKALGWDIDNEQGYAEDYQDVIHADAIKTTDGTKAPDYCFRIGGTRKFFLEARRPSVDIKNDVSPAFQLRRYGLTEAEITIVVERNEPAHPAPPPAWRISRRHRTT